MDNREAFVIFVIFLKLSETENESDLIRKSLKYLIENKIFKKREGKLIDYPNFFNFSKIECSLRFL